MSDPWKILGIDRTNDKILIKSTFAKLLKENPPDKDAEKYQEIRKAYEEALKEAKSIKSVAEAEEIFLTKAETEYQPHSTELDKPEESDFDELEEKPTTGPGQEAPNMENIRKLMEMLSSRKAVSLADLVKSYKIFPVKKMSDNKREKSSSSRSSSSSYSSKSSSFGSIFWKFIKILRIIFGIIALIVAISKF